MLLLLAIACTPEDTGTAPYTSDTIATVKGAPTAECDGDTFHLQIGFDMEVGSVVAEVRSPEDDSPIELHPIDYGGTAEDDPTTYLYDVELATGASQAELGVSTVFVCDDVPIEAFRAYDADGGIQACFIGDFVTDYFDATGCPS